MARIARAVVPGYPHHITQCGNRRQQTFFRDDDYLAYIELMAEWCRNFRVEIWAWCLMPNHVHLVAVPHTDEALSRAIGEAHRRIPGGSISVKNGEVICGRKDLLPFQWMSNIYWQQPGISK
jgi:hypothetical protein